MRYLSVCSGMEAASVAWHPLGWTPVGFSEIEPFPCAILKHRFPNTPNYGSLTEYQSWPLEPGAIDLLVGGTPCQSFSVAGLRKGLTDPRGNLALSFLALADRLKPRWVVFENVPGLLSSNGGRDFGSFLGALVELGYGFAYRVLDAQHFGVPQRRRRVFVVACLGDWRAAAEVLSLREGLRGYLETGNKKRKSPAADAGAGPTAGCWWDGGQVSQTLDAVLAKGQTMPEKNRFPAVLTPVSHWDGGDVHPTLNQSAKGSGGVGSSNQELFSQGGAYLVPGEPIPIQDGREIEKHQSGLGIAKPGAPAYTLDTTGAQAAAIPYRKSKRACSTTDNETWVPADASNTLNNFDLGDTRTTHAVVQPVAWTQNQREEVRLLGDKVGAITLPGTHQTNYIAEPQVYENHAQDSRVTGPLEVAPTVAAKFGTGGGNVPLVGAMAVRRLTPVECERLQGFPDNWSRISWKGKPEEECPDGPRYKACGNSMAVPVMRWIGERIAAVDSTL
jgi:DNA (cytosine-5)-methyltransferase 1